MAETLLALLDHLESRAESLGSQPVRVVVWAHNSNLGDARATLMGDEGEVNLGQLVRERAGADAVLVGFTTHTGTVTAAQDWDSPAEVIRVRPSLPGSVERLFHDIGIPRFILPLRGAGGTRSALGNAMLERAIGVIYRPRTERSSHYFTVKLSEQCPEAPETYPTGV